jgi:hypothetical protein
VRSLTTLVLMTLMLASCGLVGEEDDSELTVTVIKGIELAPVDLGRASGPVAHYLADSQLIVFVSGPLYSGSCPPDAQARASEDRSVTLTLDHPDGDCTSDANRYTFLIQGFPDTPSDLVVEEDGLEDIELELAE